MENKSKTFKQIKQSSEQISLIEQSIKSVTLIRKVFRCLDCYFIPLLNINENNNNITINCLQGHTNQLSLNDYMIKGFDNSLDQVKCSICKFKREPKMIYKLCEECNNIMCKECLKFHNSKNLNHHTITVRKMDIICCLHHLNFTFFCKKCNKNICDKCLNEHKHEENKIICLKDFNFNEKEIEEIKHNIEKEKNVLNDIINIFNENMINLQHKFNEMIKDRKQIIKYKNNLYESYELKNINYQVIHNLKQLKFKTDFINFEQNIDELKNIRKVFEFLNEKNKNVDAEKELKYHFNKYTIIKENELSITGKKENKIVEEKNYLIIKEKEILINKKKKKEEEKRIVKNMDIFINKNISKREKEFKSRIVKINNIIIKEKKNEQKNKENKSKNIIANNINFFITKKEKDKYREDIDKILAKNNNNEIVKTGNINIINDKKSNNEEKIHIIPKNKYKKNITLKDNQEQLKSQIPSQLNINFKYKNKSNLDLINNNKTKNKIEEKKENNFIDQNINDKKIIRDYNDNDKFRELEINKNKKLNIYNPKITLRKKIDKNIEENENENIINEYEESIKLPMSPTIKEINPGKKLIESFLLDKSEKIDIILDEMINTKYKNNDNIKEINNTEERMKSFDKSRRRKKKYLGKLIPRNEDENLDINKTFDYAARKKEYLGKKSQKDRENGKKMIYKGNSNDKSDKYSSVYVHKSNKVLDLKNSFEENKENINNENIIINKKNFVKINNNIYSKNENNENYSENINYNGGEKINETFEVSFKKRPKKTKRKIINDNLSKSFDNNQKNELISKNKINLIKGKHNRNKNKSLDIGNYQKSISVKHYFSSYEIINKMEIDSCISSILEINSNIFCIGNFNGKIKLYNLNQFNEKLRFTAHDGAINYLFLLHDNAILSASNDKMMKKISFKNYFSSYNIDFIFNGFNNILKGIELESNHNIISFSNNKKIYFWVKDKNKNNYKNSFIYTEKCRILDILGISKSEFVSLSEIELKYWNSNSFDNIYKIKLEKNYGKPNFLYKINKEVLSLNYYHYISLINNKNKNIINTIKMCDGELTQMIKLNDESILIAEEKISGNNIIFYIKQYEYINENLNYISFKKSKFVKNDINGEKEIRALIQFSNGIIVQNIFSQNNGKSFSELVFYK